jgi:hypothetical protein
MTSRAVITVRDTRGQRRFYQQHASKQFQIPHLAEFIAWADEQARPLALPAYLEHVAARPGALPGQDVTGAAWCADPGQAIGLDCRYELVLDEAAGGFAYTVYDRLDGQDGPGWQAAEHLAVRADLYAAAACMCEQLACAADPVTAERAGLPSADDWHAHAERFRRLGQQAAR